MVENVGNYVAVAWKLKLHRTAEQKITDFSMEGAHGFPGLQVLKRVMLTRRTPEHPELNSQVTGLVLFLKFAPVAKNVPKREYH